MERSHSGISRIGETWFTPLGETRGCRSTSVLCGVGSLGTMEVDSCPLAGLQKTMCLCSYWKNLPRRMDNVAFIKDAKSKWAFHCANYKAEGIWRRRSAGEMVKIECRGMGFELTVKSGSRCRGTHLGAGHRNSEARQEPHRLSRNRGGDRHEHPSPGRCEAWSDYPIS